MGARSDPSQSYIHEQALHESSLTCQAEVRVDGKCSLKAFPGRPRTLQLLLVQQCQPCICKSLRNGVRVNLGRL